VEGDDGGAKLGVGAIGGATDAITGDRRRSREGGRGGGLVGSAGGAGLREEDGEAADGDDSNSNSEPARQDVWCLTTGVACSATTRPVAR
jgi:hypothetical protein